MVYIFYTYDNDRIDDIKVLSFNQLRDYLLILWKDGVENFDYFRIIDLSDKTNLGKPIHKMKRINKEEILDIIYYNPADILILSKHKKTGSHKKLPNDILKEVKKYLQEELE